MADIIFKKTHNTPKVFLTSSEGICEISGPSYANHISEIYTAVLAWIEEEIPFCTDKIDFIFNFELLNSVSYKFIIEMIMRLNDFVKEGKNIQVKWYYAENDDDMYSTGKDLSDLFELPFEIKKFE